MNKNIQVIEANDGTLTIQNTATFEVAIFKDKQSRFACENLKAVLEGSDMGDWDTFHEGFITDQTLAKWTPGGGLKLWSEQDIEVHLQSIAV